MDTIDNGLFVFAESELNECVDTKFNKRIQETLEASNDKTYTGCDASSHEEVRFVDPDTGAEKGVKKARFDLIPTGPLWELAEHYGSGASKYEPHNFRRGYPWGFSYSAALRHLNQFWNGEDFDPETGSKHVIAAAWHCFALASFMDEHPSKDDRFRSYNG